jgi:hypothetical protein
MRFEYDPRVLERIAWGLPESPRRPFCALCHGFIGEDDVPLMIWRADGSGASICDKCIGDLLHVAATR